MPSKNPLNLVWCDLEFTTIDLARARLLQVAMLVTTPELEPLPTPDGQMGLGFDLRVTAADAAAASSWVKENQGELLARCQEAATPTPAEVEPALQAYLADACGLGGQPPFRERALLAGNSVHVDLRLLTEAMPRLGTMLSFRVVDVTTLKELAVRWRPDVRLDKSSETALRAELAPLGLTLDGKPHDAMYDIKTSIAELAYYRRVLIQPRA